MVESIGHASPPAPAGPDKVSGPADAARSGHQILSMRYSVWQQQQQQPADVQTPSALVQAGVSFPPKTSSSSVSLISIMRLAMGSPPLEP
jgi:hypothetical protein